MSNIRRVLKLLVNARGRRKYIALVARTLTTDENILPYWSVFTAGPGFSFPENFSIANYPGLLFCHTSANIMDTKVIACWRHPNQFRAYERRFKQDLALSVTNWTGAVVQVCKPAEALWKRHSLAASILGIAALFGALSAIRDYFTVLFGAPYAGLAYTENRRIDVVERGSIAVPFTVLSEVRFAPMKVTFDSASIRPKASGSGQKLAFDNTVLSSLSPGQSAIVKLYGVAPEHSKTNYSPDVYDIHAVATAQAGIFRARRSVEPPSRELWVWPERLGASPLRFLQIVGTNNCVLGGSVYPSKPYPRGVRIEIVYARAPQEIAKVYLEATGTNFGDTSFVDVGVGPNRVMKKEFNTSALTPFEEFHYKIYLYLSKPIASHDCANWSHDFQVAVD